jgi:nuclear pore complex protein Nup85
LLNKLEQELDEMEMEMERADEVARSHEDVEDERLEFEAQFRCLLELMIGIKERVFEACDDWREALGAWGMLVQPSLKRDDIPQVVQVIFDTFPIDGTAPMDEILSSLARGDVLKSCQATRKYDPWLAAHMTDLLNVAGILDDGEVEDGEEHQNIQRSGEAIRQKAIEEYAETLLDDQGLWRLAVDYLAYCGVQARRRMRHILLDVPLSGPQAQPSRTEVKRAEDVEREAMEIEEDLRADDPDEAVAKRKEQLADAQEAKRTSDEYNTAMEVIQTCIDLNLQDEARAVCKRMATEMVKQNRMGPALAYCVRARDIRQIRRIVDDILWLYVERGLEEFCTAVDSIPISLLTGPEGKEHDGATVDDMRSDLDKNGTLDVLMSQDVNLTITSRLVFLARYRDFHRLYTQNDLRSAAALLAELVASNTAPEPFRAILLIDAIPLLQNEQGLLLTSDENFELLRVLDAIAQSAASNARQAHHFLGMLEALLTSESGHKVTRQNQREEDEESEGGPESTKHDVRTAARRLDILRLALARQLAHSIVA